MISGLVHCRPRQHPYIFFCTYCTISDMLDIGDLCAIIESVAPNPRAVLVFPTREHL